MRKGRKVPSHSIEHYLKVGAGKPDQIESEMKCMVHVVGRALASMLRWIWSNFEQEVNSDSLDSTH